jgi:hypothetical protein
VRKFVGCCDRNLVGVLFVFNFPLYLFNFVHPSRLGMLSLSLFLFVINLIPQLIFQNFNIQNPNYIIFKLNHIENFNIENPNYDLFN